MNNFYFFDNKNNIYTIKNRELEKINNIKNEQGFDIKMLNSIPKESLNKYLPLKLCTITEKDNIDIIRITQNNSFILLNISQCNNIKLLEEHLMLVTNDKKTWFNYYDEKVNNIFVSSDKWKIINYINTNCKMNSIINKKYNFVLIKLNKGETLLNLYTQIKPNYKKNDVDISLLNNTISFSDAEIVNILDSNSNILDSLKAVK